jgi:NAD(P)-dependent dehydrogenase (short-subunit alcohol dehydrogenase family)
MKILVLGASGTIGRAIVESLGEHDIIKAGFSSGDVKVDMESDESIKKMYLETGEINGVISASGKAAFGSVASISDDDLRLSLHNKLGGQINLVRFGIPFLKEKGFFTLTSGDLSTKPNSESSLITTVGIAIEGFARASSLSMPKDLRINVVSPSLIRESAEKFNLPLEGSIPAADVALWYLESLSDSYNGMVRDVEGWS